MPGVTDHPAQARQPRCIAHELERPDEAEQARAAGIEHDVEHAGKRAEEIESPGERGDPGEPRLPLSAVCRAGSSGRGHQTKHVFGKEERADDLKSGVERTAISLAPFAHRIGEHDADPGRDHRMMHAAEDPRGRIAGLGMQNLVEPLLVHAPL